MATDELTQEKFAEGVQALSTDEKATSQTPGDTAATSRVEIAQEVNPWSVSGAVVDGKVKAIDYDRLVDTFGTQVITKELLERFERVTGHRPHPFLRRGLVFSHRDLEWILTKYEKGEPFFLYTGRGPSSDSMHLGHMIPFTFTKCDPALCLSSPSIEHGIWLTNDKMAAGCVRRSIGYHDD